MIMIAHDNDHLVIDGVPESDACLRSIRLVVGVDNSRGEVAPAVVGPDVGEVDEGVYRQGDAQRPPLPGAARQVRAGHFQGAHVLGHFLMNKR